MTSLGSEWNDRTPITTEVVVDAEAVRAHRRQRTTTIVICGVITLACAVAVWVQMESPNMDPMAAVGR